MDKISVFICVLLLCVQTSMVLAAAPEVLTIAGTGDSQTLLRKLANEFNTHNPESRAIIPNSIGSDGGINALLAGDIKLARTARPLKEKELGQGLIEYHFADSPIAFVTNPSVVGIDSLTTTQIIGIYSGKYRRWSELGGPEKKIYPIDREAGDSSRKTLEKYLTGFSDINSRAKIYYNTQDASIAIKDHAYTIGFIPLSVALDMQLKVLRINNMTPYEDSTSKSDYPYLVPFYLVSKGEPEGAAARFLQFLLSDKIQRRMRSEGIRSVKQVMRKQNKADSR